MSSRKGGVGPVLAIGVLGLEKARKLGRQQQAVGAPRVVAGLQAPVGFAQVDNLDKGARKRLEPRQTRRAPPPSCPLESSPQPALAPRRRPASTAARRRRRRAPARASRPAGCPPPSRARCVRRSPAPRRTGSNRPRWSRGGAPAAGAPGPGRPFRRCQRPRRCARGLRSAPSAGSARPARRGPRTPRRTRHPGPPRPGSPGRRPAVALTDSSAALTPSLFTVPRAAA